MNEPKVNVLGTCLCAWKTKSGNDIRERSLRACAEPTLKGRDSQLATRHGAAVTVKGMIPGGIHTLYVVLNATKMDGAMLIDTHLAPSHTGVTSSH